MKPGDEIALTGRNKITRIRVLSVPTTRQSSRKEATNLYEMLGEEPLDLS